MVEAVEGPWGRPTGRDGRKPLRSRDPLAHLLQVDGWPLLTLAKRLGVIPGELQRGFLGKVGGGGQEEWLRMGWPEEGALRLRSTPPSSLEAHKVGSQPFLQTGDWRAFRGIRAAREGTPNSITGVLPQ